MHSNSARIGGNVEDADWLHLTEGEQVRWTGRPSRFTILPALAFALVLAVAGVLLWSWATGTVDSPWLAAVPLAVTVVGLALAAYTYLDWLRLLYVITDEELYVKRGLVSRDVTQVRLDRVQNTACEQSVRERLLSYGDVRIYTAGSGTEDLTFRDVPNPERVARTLTELLRDQASQRQQP